MRPPWAPEGRAAPAVLRVLAVVALAVVVLVLAALAAGSPAAGQDDDGDSGLGLEVEVGYGGRTGGAAWMPVTVTLQPDRLVAGTLAVEVAGQNGGVREERAIEVTVGSRNAYRFVLPRGAVVASVDQGAGDPVTVRVPPGRDDGDFLAGVLGGVPSSPPPVRSEVLGVSASWVAVDAQWAELSAGALAPLSGLVADGRALAALSEDGLRNVAAAVAAGLDLVVVAPVPADLALPWDLEAGAWTLPAAAVTDDAGTDAAAAVVVPAGRGRVATTMAGPGEGALGGSSALWSALIEPRPTHASGEEHLMGGAVGSVLGAGSSGVPALPWLAVFLVAYILVVGPVNGVVLARLGRRELAWVTVPAVTVVFTAAGWLGATGSQPPVGFAGSATAWVDGTATESVVAVVRAPTPGRRELALPGGGWEVRTEGVSQPAVVQRVDGLRADLDLPALQPGGIVARRTVDLPAPLRVEAEGTPAGLTVTVTNVAAETVSDVTVRAATASTRIGALEPGEVRTVTLEGDHLPVADFMGGGGPPLPMPGAPQQGPLALATVLADELDGDPGLVWAAGTTATSATGVRIDERAPQDLGGYVAVAVRATGSPRLHSVDRELVDAGPDAYRPAPLTVEGSGPAILRFRIPPAGIGAAVRPDLRTPDVFGPGHDEGPELSLWQRSERQWRPLDDALVDGGGAPAEYVSPLGEVFVRVSGPLQPLHYSGMGLAVEEGS